MSIFNEEDTYLEEGMEVYRVKKYDCIQKQEYEDYKAKNNEPIDYQKIHNDIKKKNIEYDKVFKDIRENAGKIVWNKKPKEVQQRRAMFSRKASKTHYEQLQSCGSEHMQPNTVEWVTWITHPDVPPAHGYLYGQTGHMAILVGFVDLILEEANDVMKYAPSLKSIWDVDDVKREFDRPSEQDRISRFLSCIKERVDEAHTNFLNGTTKI